MTRREFPRRIRAAIILRATNAAGLVCCEPDLLKQLLRLDPASGRLFWLPRPRELFPDDRIRAAWNTRWAGKEAFRAKHQSGYRTGGLFGRTQYAHRVVWAIHTGSWPEVMIDHINGDPADNRPANLRLACNAENARNSRSRPGSTSAFKGVHWSRGAGKWCAQITVGGRAKNIGYFLAEVDAARAYDKEAIILHGEFAALNFGGGGDAA